MFEDCKREYGNASDEKMHDLLQQNQKTRTENLSQLKKDIIGNKDLSLRCKKAVRTKYLYENKILEYMQRQVRRKHIKEVITVKEVNKDQL
jgi:hypothetical protein